MDNIGLSKISNYNKFNVENLAKKANNSKENDELKKVCESFETYFINEMYKQMKSSIGQDGVMPMGKGEEMFSGMLDEEYSKTASKKGGIGISDLMYKQMSKHNKLIDKTN